MNTLQFIDKQSDIYNNCDSLTSRNAITCGRVDRMRSRARVCLRFFPRVRKNLQFIDGLTVLLSLAVVAVVYLCYCFSPMHRSFPQMQSRTNIDDKNPLI